MSKNNSIIGFIVGAAIGSIVTWAISKNEYEKRIDEEIQSMRRRDKKADKETASESDVCEEREDGEVDEMALENAKKIIEEQKYGDIKMGQSNVKKNCSPHVITPEEFGELYDYEKISLTYYVDHESKKSKKVNFCGNTFSIKKIDIPSSDKIKTIKKSSRIRYIYYGVPAKCIGTIFTELKNGTIADNNVFYKNMTIEETNNELQRNAVLPLFWTGWVILSCFIIYGWFYLKNDWLE